MSGSNDQLFCLNDQGGIECIDAMQSAFGDTELEAYYRGL